MSELEDAVPELVLGAWGFAGARTRAFERGLINRHWLARQGNRQLVFRRYNAVRSRAAAGWEQELVRFASTRGWPVAPTMPSDSGGLIEEHEGRLWSAMPFLPGAPEMAATEANYRQLGTLIARLHVDLAEFPVGGQRPDFGQAWDLDAWAAPYGVGTFEELVSDLSLEEPELAEMIRREREATRRELAETGYGSLALSPVHGDFQDFNLLWSEGELTGLLDFDFSRQDAQVCDLATMLVPFMPLDPALAGAMFGGYEAVRPLTDVERRIVPALVRSLLLCWVALLLTGRRTGANPDAVHTLRRTVTKRIPAVRTMEPAWAHALGLSRD